MAHSSERSGARGALAPVLADAAQVLRPGADERHGPLAPLLVALTVVTGVVDAVSYLTLGHVFVANMTGNVVFLGFAIAGAPSLSIPTSLAAIAAFLVGAAVGGRLTARHPEHRGRMLRDATACQGTLVVLALVIALSIAEPPSDPARYALLVPLALAMGIQNAAAQRINIPDLTTTVLTRTLTGLAFEARAAGGGGAKSGRRLVAVAGMLIGAIAGALLALEASIAAALVVALALIGTVAVAVHLASAPDAPWART